MGNNFPQVTNLKDNPGLVQKTLGLIEKSFQYEGKNSFQIDFAPLIDVSNHHNCFILVNENDEVIAHIGAKDKIITLAGIDYPVTMLGGIAVDEAHRGEGHFQTLLQDVLAEKRSETTFFLLWSDNVKLYGKYGFHLCGAQLEISNENPESGWTKTKYHSLPLEEKQDIQSLYEKSFAHAYLTFNRNKEDWDLIEKITSTDLYIKKSGNHIQSYFFTNKGQDLPGIIFEYGTSGSMAELISEIQGFGKVWMGSPILETENQQYQFFMCPADQRQFNDFVDKFTQGKIKIRQINVMKQEVFFDFNEETLMLSAEEFLTGIFGPGPFEELEEIPSIFISGLDSI